MNTDQTIAKQLANAILEGINIEPNMIVAVFPPYPYLGIVGDILKSSLIDLGAQNFYPEMEGAFTGEVSPKMLLDLGCKYIIIGHSERRQKLGESESFINDKVRAALKANLHVILCVGETLVQREADQTEKILNEQLIQGLEGVNSDTMNMITIAYEPVWAIGNHGKKATPIQAQTEQALIRYRIGQMFGEEISQSLFILYGGSVTPENAASLFNSTSLDGLLVGTDSLDAEHFLSIIKAGSYAVA
jgi:triosephosphate isomerase